MSNTTTETTAPAERAKEMQARLRELETRLHDLRQRWAAPGTNQPQRDALDREIAPIAAEADRLRRELPAAISTAVEDNPTVKAAAARDALIRRRATSAESQYNPTVWRTQELRGARGKAYLTGDDATVDRLTTEIERLRRDSEIYEDAIRMTTNAEAEARNALENTRLVARRAIEGDA